VPYQGHEMRWRKQLQTSPHEQGEDGSTGPSPGQHCLSIGTLQQGTQVFEHSLKTTGQYKWDAKKIMNWTISLGRREYFEMIGLVIFRYHIFIKDQQVVGRKSAMPYDYPSHVASSSWLFDQGQTLAHNQNHLKKPTH
jgi:hypothetical protein